MLKHELSWLQSFLCNLSLNTNTENRLPENIDRICACHPCVGVVLTILCAVESLTDGPRRESGSDQSHHVQYWVGLDLK